MSLETFLLLLCGGTALVEFFNSRLWFRLWFRLRGPRRHHGTSSTRNMNTTGGQR